MAPKVAKAKEQEVKLDEEAQKAVDESKYLKGLCFDHGIAAKARRMDTNSGVRLPARLDGKDIVKKGNMRKNRYLLNIPAKLSAMTAGKLGSLAQLDTRNPVLYIDFEAGRLKFKGTLFFPKNKYMTLKLAQKEVRCEDVFESLIVFSEHTWIGTKEENPEELPLPMPSTIPIAPEEEEKGAPQSQQGPDFTQAEATQAEPSQEINVRSSQRKRQRPTYAEHSQSEGEQESDSDPGPEKRARRKAPASASKARAKDLGKSEGKGAAIVLSDDSEDDGLHNGSDEDSVQIVGSSQRSRPVRSVKPKKKSLAPILEEDSDQEFDADDRDNDSDFNG